MTEEPTAKNGRHATTRLAPILRWGLAVALLAAIVAGLLFLPILEYLESLFDWIESLGSWGPVLFIGLHIVVCLCLLPGSVLTLAAGFLFGVVWGTAWSSLGLTLGATAAFLVARTVLRGRVEYKLANYPKILRVDHALSDRGFQIVWLARLCPMLPFGLISYVFGLTEVTLGRYVLATFLGKLPEVVLLVCIGSTARSIADLLEGKVEFGAEQYILLGLGISALAAIVIVVARVARKALSATADD